MAYTDVSPVAQRTSNRSFQHVSSRFPEPLECLTAYLFLEASEVLGGIKPANLVSLVNRRRPCGRNLFQLWHSYHTVLSSRLANMCIKVLQTGDRALLLFCYNPDHLETHLAHPGIRVLLKRAGYDGAQSSESLLAELCRRVECSGGFPHEIGLFIGYPAKDVAAFMGLVTLPFACQGPWKIYGNPVQSLGLADQYRCCREKMNDILASGDSTALELHNPEHPFFCRNLDKGFQYHGRGNP